MKKRRQHTASESSAEPGGLFSSIPRDGDVKVPQEFFGAQEEEIMDSVFSKADSRFFDAQESGIMLKVKMEGHQGEEWKVPDGYFQTAEERVMMKLADTKQGNVFHIRRWMPWLAAACVVSAVALFWWNRSANPEELTFAEVMEAEEIDEEDLASIATEDELYELYVHHFEEDTIAPADSVQMITPLQSDIVPGEAEVIKLDEFGMPLNEEIKPGENEDVPSWDDLTEEEIIRFLIEEGEDGDDPL